MTGEASLGHLKDHIYLLIVAAAIWVGIQLWHEHSMTYGYDLIAPGDPEEKVIWLMGWPDDVDHRIGLGGESWILEYNYLSSMRRGGEEGWTIRFDKESRVVKKGPFRRERPKGRIP
jgi:hypothetical protein